MTLRAGTEGESRVGVVESEKFSGWAVGEFDYTTSRREPRLWSSTFV